MVQPSRSRRRSGFTLIELVIVLLVVVIASAVALPRFLNIGGEARRASAEALSASVRTAAQAVRAAALARGRTEAGPGGMSHVDLNGATIQTNHGYPEASRAGILIAANISADDKVTVVGGGAAPGSSITIQIDGAPDPAQCRVVYTSPNLAASPTITAPVIELATAGC
jgi:MSHA pilin protein MshA